MAHTKTNNLFSNGSLTERPTKSAWLTLMAFSLCLRCRPCPSSPLLPVYRGICWVTPTPVMSSLIFWCNVFLERPRRLVSGTVRSITLRVTLFTVTHLWTCPIQRRRPLRITSSIGERCSRISSFRLHIQLYYSMQT